MKVLRLLEQVMNEDPTEALASEFVMNGWVVLKDSPLAVYNPDLRVYATVKVEGSNAIIGDKSIPFDPNNEDQLALVVQEVEKSAVEAPKKEPSLTTTLLSLIMSGKPPHAGDRFVYEDFLISFDGEKAVATNTTYGYSLAAEYPGQGDKTYRAMELAYALFNRIEKARKIEPLYSELASKRLDTVRKRIRELAREAGIKVTKVDDWTLDLDGNILDLRVIKEMEEEDRAIVSEGISKGLSRSEILGLLKKRWEARAEELFRSAR